MVDLLQGLNIAQLSAGVILALTVLGIFRGLLVPKGVCERLVKTVKEDKDARLAERSEEVTFLREANKDLTEAYNTVNGHMTALIEAARVQESLIRTALERARQM